MGMTEATQWSARTPSDQIPIGHKVMELLRNDTRDIYIVAATDSVGAENPTGGSPDPHEWVYKLGQRIANAFPALSVKHYSWNDTSPGTYRDPAATPTRSIIQTGTGAHTVHLFGYGQPGKFTPESLKYLDAGIAAPLLADGITRMPPPDLILIGEGHNASQGDITTKRSSMSAYIAQVTRACPLAELVLIAQNPEGNDCPLVTINATGGTWKLTVQTAAGTAQATGLAAVPTAKDLETALAALPSVGAGNIKVYASPNVTNRFMLQFKGKAKNPVLTADATALTGAPATVTFTPYSSGDFTNAAGMFDWPVVLRELALAGGFGFVDVWRAFTDWELYPGQQTLTPGGSVPDLTHPNDAGYELWATTVWNAMLRATAQGTPRPQMPSPLLVPVAKNYLRSGDCAVWTQSTGPDDWKPTNITYTKDFTNTATALPGFSTKLACTAAAAGYDSQDITGPELAELAGQWVTLAALWRNNGSDIQAGVIKLLDTNDTDTITYTSPTSDEGLGAFYWRTITVRLRSNIKKLTVRRYADTGGDGAGVAQFQQITLTPGVWPRRMAPTAVSDPLAAAIANYDASTLGSLLGLANNDPVSSVPDLTGRGYDLAQGTAAKQPVFKTSVQNGLSVIEFDGATSPNGDFLLSPTIPLARPYTVFLVCKFNEANLTAGQYLALSGGLSNLGGALRRASDTTVQISSTSVGTAITTTPNAWHLYTATFGTSPAGALGIDAGAETADANIGSTVAVGVCLGANSNGANGTKLQVGQLVIVNASMSNADKAAIQALLKAKWATP